MEHLEEMTNEDLMRMGAYFEEIKHERRIEIKIAQENLVRREAAPVTIWRPLDIRIAREDLARKEKDLAAIKRDLRPYVEEARRRGITE